MKPTELRDELPTRAAGSRDHSDLLPQVPRPGVITRQRRAAATVVAVGWVTALGVGVLPPSAGTATPPPAGTAPAAAFVPATATSTPTTQPSAAPPMVVPGGERVIQGDGDQLTLPEFVVDGGRLYALSAVRTSSAVASKSLSIPLPRGQRFLVSFGTTDTGPAAVRAALTGVGPHSSANQGTHGAGVGTEAGAARATGTAKVTIEAGRPTKGKLLLAVYTPIS